MMRAMVSDSTGLNHFGHCKTHDAISSISWTTVSVLLFNGGLRIASNKFGRIMRRGSPFSTRSLMMPNATNAMINNAIPFARISEIEPFKNP